jgi:hypothetical protein
MLLAIIIIMTSFTPYDVAPYDNWILQPDWSRFLLCYVNDVTGYKQEGKCSLPWKGILSSPLDRRPTELSQGGLLRDRHYPALRGPHIYLT